MNVKRGWAYPLKPLYRAGLAIKDGLRTAGLLKVKSLAQPVVSVGSLSAGGAGKTPVVIALARMLAEAGWQVDVISRGYRRTGKGVERVESNDAARYGDEPVLIAEATGLPVWVSSERYKAGLQAEAQGSAGRGVHVLDDGYQHRELARKVDILLVTTADLDDRLLPAGNLREPVTAMDRAHVLVIREKEFKRIRPRIGRIMPQGASIWLLRRQLRFPEPLGPASAGPRPIAFCAIARPDGFSSMLADSGCGALKTLAFKDHHRFTKMDIDQLVKLAERRNASGFITTEKDAVKLTPALRARLETVGPVVAVALETEFTEPERVAREMEELLR